MSTDSKASRRADELRTYIGWWAEVGLYLGPRRWQNSALYRHDGDRTKLKVRIDAVVAKTPTVYQGTEIVPPSYLVVFTIDSGHEYATSPTRFEHIVRRYRSKSRRDDEGRPE